MNQILEISKLGNKILRNECVNIDKINDDLLELISNMKCTVKEINGVGIAANQVFNNLNLFIIASHPNKRYPKAPYIEPFALINPNIIKYSKEIELSWEGCLSIPGIRGQVPRHKSILVEYLDIEFKLKKERLTDFVARVFQHEYDHINGLVYLDRIKDNKKIISEFEFNKITV